MSTFYKIYGVTQDHNVNSYNHPTYAASRTTVLGADAASATPISIGEYFAVGPQYSCEQGVFAFDTTPVAGLSVSGATFVLMDVGDLTAFGTLEAREHNWTYGGGTANWVSGIDLASKVLFGAATKAAGAGPLTFTGTSITTLANPYKLIVFDQRQRTNVAPTANELMHVYPADEAGTSFDPYLAFEVRYPSAREGWNAGLSARRDRANAHWARR